MCSGRPAARDVRRGAVVEVAMCARNVKKMDLLSLSDPFIVLYTLSPGHSAAPLPSRSSALTPGDARWVYFGETEVVWDGLSPRFTRRFFLADEAGQGGAAEGGGGNSNGAVTFLQQMKLRFEVFDADTTDLAAPLSAHDFIGAYEVEGRELLTKGAMVSNLCDKCGKVRSKLGQIVLSTERYVLPIDGLARKLSLTVAFAEGVDVPPGEAVFYNLVREAQQPESNGDEGMWGGAGGSIDWVVLHRSGAMRSPKRASRALEAAIEFQDAELTVLEATAGRLGRLLCIELYLHRANGCHVQAGRSESFTIQMLKRSAREGQYVVLAPPPRSAGGGGTGGGVITSGAVCITGHIIPDADAVDDALSSCSSKMSESTDRSMDRTAAIARGVGSMKFTNESPSVVNVRFMELSWSEPKKGLLDGPGGGLRASFKIRSARV